MKQTNIIPVSLGSDGTVVIKIRKNLFESNFSVCFISRSFIRSPKIIVILSVKGNPL